MQERARSALLGGRGKGQHVPPPGGRHRPQHRGRVATSYRQIGGSRDRGG
jgi:hypothetical protein